MLRGGAGVGTPTGGRYLLLPPNDVTQPHAIAHCVTLACLDHAREWRRSGVRSGPADCFGFPFWAFARLVVRCPVLRREAGVGTPWRVGACCCLCFRHTELLVTYP